MSKPNRRRVKLAQIVTEINASKPTIEIETDDGQVFAVPPAELWPDEAIECADDDPVNAARLVMGVDQYKLFHEAGGSATLMFAVIQQVTGVTPGELSPS